MNTTNIVNNLMPGFVQGTTNMHNALMLPAMMLCVVGLGMRFLLARDLDSFGWPLVRLIFVAVFIVNIFTIGSNLQNAATEITNSLGFNVQTNMLGDYQAALATKFNVVTQTGNTNPWQWLFNAADTAGIVTLGVIVYILSIVAFCVMLLVTAIQQVIFYLDLGVSPLFLACIMVPVLIPLATRFATSFVAICVLPIGFRILDLLMKGLLDLATNSGNNNGITIANAAGGNLILWTLIAILGIFGYGIAPFFIVRSMTTNGAHGLHMVGPSIGSVLMTAFAANRIIHMVGNAANAMAGPPPRAVPPPIPQSHNYATRPGVAV